LTPYTPDSHAYDVAIECAALCMIALGSSDSEEFREQMRDAFREALYLRGALLDSERFVDKFEARNVLSQVVTRAIAIMSGDSMPIVDINISPEIGNSAELALYDSLHAVLTRIDEMCLSGD
jgi:hypothetical protein